MKQKSLDMLHGPLFSSIVIYTIPIIFTSVLQLLFNAADLIVIGRFRGSAAVGAVGATGAITTLIVNLFIGLSVGAGVAVAHAIGAGHRRILQRTVHTAMTAALISGAFLTVVGICCAEPLLRLMGTPATLLPLSTLYMRIYFGGITFTMIYNFCAAILRAAGDTKGPLLYLTTAGIVNVILNLIFVVWFQMSVEGVALATVIAQSISALLVTRALMHRQDGCQLFLSKLRIHKYPLLKMMRIGIPAGIQGALFSISNVIIQSSINSFGDTMVAANAAASNLDSLVYTTLNAFSQSAVNFSAQNMAAGFYKRVKQVLWICMGLVIGTGLVTGTAMVFASPYLLSIYVTDSPQAISLAVMRITILCLPYFLCGLQEVTTGMLRGIGSSMVPMALSVLGICGLRLFWVLVLFRLPAFHTPQALYFSYPLSWLVTFILEFAAFFLIFRRALRQLRIIS